MKEVRIIYFMDPICSFCWALSGILRRLNLEYGDQFSLETHMGGLMPPGGFDKSSEEYMSNEDLAILWDSASENLGVPINGKIWLEAPLKSSYVAGIAYKSAALQDQDKADRFLRLIQEKLFVESIDISNPSTVIELAATAGLDCDLLQLDSESRGYRAFQKDLELLHKLQVQLFPTLFLYNARGDYKVIENIHNYSTYEKLLLELKPDLIKRNYVRDASVLLKYFGSMTINDLIVLLEITERQAELKLEALVASGLAVKTSSPKGALWRLSI